MHIRLAQKNRAGLVQARGNFAIFLGDEIRKNFRSGGGADTAAVKVILQGDRNAE
jgi:hypothetical protein